MYIRKGVRLRVEPWERLALTRYSYEYFPLSTTQIYILTRNKEMRLKTRSKLLQNLSFWPAFETLSNTLDMSIATVQVALKLLRCPSNSNCHSCQKICSWKRRHKTKLEIKRLLFSSWSTNQFTSFSQTLLTTERKQRSLPNILKHWVHIWNIPQIQQSGKLDSFKHLLKRSANMCEHLGSQFLRTTTGIQSGPNAEIKIGYLFNHLHSYSNIK